MCTHMFPPHTHLHRPESSPRSIECRGDAGIGGQAWSLWVGVLEKAAQGGGTKERWEPGAQGLG